MTCFFNDYVIDRVVGEGAFGQVWSAVRRSDGLRVAIKQVDITSSVEFVDDDIEGFLPMEIYLLNRVSHIPGVSRILDYLLLDKKYFVVMEYVSHDLFSIVQARGHLSESWCKYIFRQILNSMMACHRVGVFHGDLKLENVLFDCRDSTTYVIDFGNGEPFKPGYLRQFHGTKAYCPPEWLRYRMQEAEATTVWTLGVMLYEMSQGCVPFEDDSDILRGEISFPKVISQTMREFISKCLSDLWTRPTLRQLQNEFWLKI